MEQQLLFLLDFDLRFDEATAIQHWLPFLPARSTSPQQDRETRQLAVNKLKASRAHSHNAAALPTPPRDAFPRMSRAHSSSGMLSVPTADSHKELHRRSPALSNVSPLSSDEHSGTDSNSSTGSMTDYYSGSSSAESDTEEDTKAAPGCFPVAGKPNQETSACVESSPNSSGPKHPRVSFALPLRPAPARATSGRSSSVHFSSVHHRRSFLCDTGNGPTLPTSYTLPTIPRIRESVSSGFLSRMFGVGGNKDKSDRVEKGSNMATLDSMHDEDSEVSRSTSKPLKDGARCKQRLQYTYHDGFKVIAN